MEPLFLQSRNCWNNAIMWSRSTRTRLSLRYTSRTGLKIWIRYPIGSDNIQTSMSNLGARQAELGRQPHRAAKFFAEFQDRILFGTDSEPVPAAYANYFRWLETGDEYFPYSGYPGQGRRMIYGIELPDSILEKVYHKNAEKIFAMYRGEHR
jgi:hypothetical protein